MKKWCELEAEGSGKKTTETVQKKQLGGLLEKKENTGGCGLESFVEIFSVNENREFSFRNV